MNRATRIAIGSLLSISIVGGSVVLALGEDEASTSNSVATRPSTSAIPQPVDPAQQPTPELEVADDPAVEPGDQPRDIQLATLGISWDRLSPAEQDSICQMGYMTGFDVVANEFLAIGESDDQFSFSVVRDFFYDACNS